MTNTTDKRGTDTRDIQEQAFATEIIPCVGSFQWAMNRGHLYRVDGGQFKYGQHVTGATSPLEAAQSILYRGEAYSVWIPSGTVLTVWNEYRRDFLRDPQTFTVLRGEVY